MEMMIVLLIVAIIAAASAPMVSRKMMRDAAGSDSPWVFTGTNNDIAYNISGAKQTAIIGARRYNAKGSGVDYPRLVLAAGDATTQPAFVFAKKNGDYDGQLTYSTDNHTAALTSATISKYTVALGTDQTIVNNKNEDNPPQGVVAIGAKVTASDPCSIAIGYEAKAADSGTFISESESKIKGSNIAIGTQAYAGDTDNIAIGHRAQTQNSSGTDSSDYAIAIGSGSSALKNNSLALGYQAHANGDDSVAIGFNALTEGTSGAIAIGAQTTNPLTNISLQTIANKTSSIAIGAGASARSQGSISIGESAFCPTGTDPADGNGSGRHCIAIGYQAANLKFGSIAMGRTASTSGAADIAIGNGAKTGYNGDDSESIAIGSGATTSNGMQAIAIGHNATAKARRSIAIGSTTADKENQIVIGNSTNTVVIPGRLIVRGDVKLGTNANANIEYREGGTYYWSLFGDIDGLKMHASRLGAHGVDAYEEYYTHSRKYSDRRLKNVGKPFEGGLAELKKLDLYHYTFKKDEAKTPHVGVMAQDLEKVFPDAVTKGEDGFLCIRMEDMFYAVVNAVKELDAKIAAVVEDVKNLVTRVNKQDELIQAQQKTIEEQQALIENLEKRIEKLEKSDK